MTYRSLPRQSQLSTVHDWMRTRCRGVAGANKQWRGQGVAVAAMPAEMSCREARVSEEAEEVETEWPRGRQEERGGAARRDGATEPMHRKHRGRQK